MAAKIRLLRPRTIVLLLLSAGFVAFGLYNMQQETKPRAKVLENKEFSLPAPHGGKHQPQRNDCRQRRRLRRLHLPRVRLHHLHC